MDAMIMFGFELVDGVPEGDGWIKQLKLLSIDVSDSDDEVEREFLYKKFVVVTPEDLKLVTDISGLSAEAIREAEASFPGNA